MIFISRCRRHFECEMGVGWEGGGARAGEWVGQDQERWNDC